MSKAVHVLADESLGGVKREYIELDREANDGDLIMFYQEQLDTSANKPYKIEVVNSYDVSFIDDNNDKHWLDTPSADYAVIEPTDIVHIDGTRYRMVDRRSEVGDKVIVIKRSANDVFYELGDIGKVLDADADSAYVDFSNGQGIIAHYRVLEPVADETHATSDDADSVIDLLANLAKGITDLERKHDTESSEVIAKLRKLVDLAESGDIKFVRDVVTYNDDETIHTVEFTFGECE